MPQTETTVREVRAHRTRGGNTRFVLVDENGNEYTTFREEVAEQLRGVEGKHVRLEFHEQRRGDFTNIYLDRVEALEGGDEHHDDRRVDEVAWNTAIEAAPYLLGEDAVGSEVPPEELFEKLQPFKELVAEDIEDHPDEP